MAYSYVVYTGNGSTTQFNVPFPYIRREHLAVSVNYTSTSFTWINDSTVSVSPAPVAGARVEVRRVTPVNAPLVDFADGSTLVAADLDTNNLQQTYVNQEQDDQLKQGIYVDATGALTAGNQRIQNVANPVSAQDAATKTYVDTFVSQTANIANGAVTTAKLADGAVTSAKIADGTIATVDIADSAITTAKIADGNVTTSKIVDGNVTTSKLADGGTTTVKIADGNVTTIKIADSNVTTAKVADANITTAKIADANVTTAKLADGGVTTIKIADANVTTPKIADANITTAKVADGAVTDAKLATPKVSRAGDTMSGALAMGNNKITGVGTPTDAGDAATKGYADSTFWNKTSETIDSTEVWSNSNSAVATTAAVNARIVDLLNDVGSYEVVASEVTFPNAGIVDSAGQPDAGVLVAVTDATGLTWNGSGESTNATRVNGSAVTITGITGTSPITNCGMQVLSTGTLHTYTFVRFTVGTQVAQIISDNINEILQVDSNAAAAAASATAAANSATAASGSATAAANSATAAAGSATSALNSATAASSLVTTITNLGYLLNWGLITEAAGTPPTDYGVL